MKRHNPNQSSSPNVPIDLTSLLDVIFLFLLIVLASMTVGYSNKNQELDEKEKLIDEKIHEYLNETIDDEAMKQRLDDYDNQYVDTKVKFITIVGRYSNEDITKRIVSVYAPDDDPYIVDITDGTQENAYSQILNYLEEYADNNKDYAIVINVGDGDILNRDYDAIMRRIESVCNEYTNVY